WLAITLLLGIAYASVRIGILTAEEIYWNYYQYPRLKGPSYIFPQIRFGIGEVAILLWSLLGIAATLSLGRSVISGRDDKWAVRSVIAFMLGFVVLVIG